MLPTRTSKRSFTVHPKYRDSRKARAKVGRFFPCSIFVMYERLTPILRANAALLIPRAPLRARHVLMWLLTSVFSMRGRYTHVAQRSMMPRKYMLTNGQHLRYVRHHDKA